MICTRFNPKCLLCPVSVLCRAAKEGCPAEYPIKAKKKAKPERHKFWYVCTRGEAVWLEKRTGKGVWKHLWSLPEGDDLTRKGTPLPTVFHEFTHYKLTASPIHVLDAEPNESDHGGWFSREDIEQIGIPSPVKKLLLEEVFGKILLA